MEWRPIETAPKDKSTWFLAAKAGCRWAIVVRAMPLGGFQDWRGELIEGLFAPTHWMPLPEPPTK